MIIQVPTVWEEGDGDGVPGATMLSDGSVPFPYLRIVGDAGEEEEEDTSNRWCVIDENARARVAPRPNLQQR